MPDDDDKPTSNNETSSQSQTTQNDDNSGRPERIESNANATKGTYSKDDDDD